MTTNFNGYRDSRRNAAKQLVRDDKEITFRQAWDRYRIVKYPASQNVPAPARRASKYMPHQGNRERARRAAHFTT